MGEDKETYEQDQEEYQYAGEEFAEEFGGGEEYEAPRESISALPGILGKKFVVPGLIIVAAAGLYLFMTYTAEPPPEEGASVAAGPTSIEEKLAPAPAEPPVPQMTQAPQVVEPPIVPTTPVEAEPVIADLSEVEEGALKAMRERAEAEQFRLDALQQAITELNTNVGDLRNIVSTMSSKIEALEQKKEPFVKKSTPVVIKKARPARKAKRVTRRAPPMIYEVKSVVPGRAWIQSGTGEFLSIAVGERLPGYGRVESINPATGVVKLSSGAVIEYGFFDR